MVDKEYVTKDQIAVKLDERIGNYKVFASVGLVDLTPRELGIVIATLEAVKRDLLRLSSATPEGVQWDNPYRYRTIVSPQEKEKLDAIMQMRYQDSRQAPTLLTGLKDASSRGPKVDHGEIAVSTEFVELCNYPPMMPPKEKE